MLAMMTIKYNGLDVTFKSVSHTPLPLVRREGVLPCIFVPFLILFEAFAIMPKLKTKCWSL